MTKRLENYGLAKKMSELRFGKKDERVRVHQKDERVTVQQKDEAVTKLQNVSADFRCWRYPLSAELQIKVSSQVRFIGIIFFTTLYNISEQFY